MPLSGHSPRQTWLGNEYRRRFVDRGHQTFHGPGYSNFGFWTGSTPIGAHGDSLVDRLLDLVPSAHGRILDVACGQGGTTRRLAARFSAANVIAVNLFPDQLRAARDLAPGCRFALMDAARLAFAEACFDVIVCVEAAFHFESRTEFLRQSRRVLKPGGHLVLSDILVTGPSAGIPEQNVVSLAQYARSFEDAGFSPPRIVSCRDRTWEPFRRKYLWNLVRIFKWADAAVWWRLARQWDRGIADYLLVTAQKPPGARLAGEAPPR
jgi:SAM-dependent methyltransferase